MLFDGEFCAPLTGLELPRTGEVGVNTVPLDDEAWAPLTGLEEPLLWLGKLGVTVPLEEEA